MTCAPCKTDRNLTTRITIHRIKSNATRDANNEIDLADAANWEALAARWSAIKSRGGSERFASDMIQAGQTHRVYMRYDNVTRTVTPAMRLKLDSRLFNILAIVDEDEGHRWIVADVVEAKT